MPPPRPFSLSRFLRFFVPAFLAALLTSPLPAHANELTDEEIFAAVEKQTNLFSRVRKLYVFPPGRNTRIHFVRGDNHTLYVIDTANDLVFDVRPGAPVTEKAKRKLNAYRAEFAFVVKKTVQDAIANHSEAMNAKVVEIFAPKVARIQPKTISDPPPPTFEKYHVSFKGLHGKSFPPYLDLTAEVKIGADSYTLKSYLQYYSLPNMRVITK